MTHRIGSLCTGYGGLDRAVHEVLGGPFAWVADNDKGASKILAHRFPDVPNLGDITTVDWSAVEPVDIACMGFPCTDVSCAGGRAGLVEGTRSGVWSWCARAISILRPSLVIIENVRGLISAKADSDVEWCSWCLGDTDPQLVVRALAAVFADLADLGFHAEWVTVSANDVGAPHRRERVFILGWPAADAGGERRYGRPRGVGTGRSATVRQQARGDDRDGGCAPAEDTDSPTGGEWREPAPGQAKSGRSRADARGSGGALAIADPAGSRCSEGQDAGADCGDAGQIGRGSLEPQRGGRNGPLADAARPGRGRARPRALNGGAGYFGTVQNRPHGEADGEGRGASADAAGWLGGCGEHEPERGPQGRAPARGDSQTCVSWGPYEPAIQRWERALGRPAPRPTEPGRTGERLSPRFVEWMMGLPEGWVTDVPGLSRNDQLKALGNGVVPQQAVLALRILLTALDREQAA